jgi:hypothetical protein
MPARFGFDRTAELAMLVGVAIASASRLADRIAGSK